MRKLCLFLAVVCGVVCCESHGADCAKGRGSEITPTPFCAAISGVSGGKSAGREAASFSTRFFPNLPIAFFARSSSSSW